MSPEDARAQRVKEAEHEFERADDELRSWEERHQELMNKYRELVGDRELARERLELVVSETGIAGGGIRVVSVTRRKYNPVILQHRLVELNHPRLNDVVQPHYKVNLRVLDQLIAAGEIDEGVAEEALVDTEQSYQLRSKPPRIQLG